MKKSVLATSWFLLALPLLLRSADLRVLARTTDGHQVADAVASLVPLDNPLPAPTTPAVAQIPQNAQEYAHYVTVVQAGARVSFPNQDSVQHHVYSLSKAKKFEFPLYNPGQSESLVFDVSGVVTLGCNIHDWMVAYLLVVPTPYFGKTESDGTTHLTAPAGRYRLELWHPRLAKTITEEITLTADAPAAKEYTLTLKPDRRIRRGSTLRSGGY